MTGSNGCERGESRVRRAVFVCVAETNARSKCVATRSAIKSCDSSARKLTNRRLAEKVIDHWLANS